MLYDETKKARYQSGEMCALCRRFINPPQYYVRADSQVAHYRCAKKRGWRKRPKKKKFIPEFAPPRIRIIKKSDG